MYVGSCGDHNVSLCFALQILTSSVDFLLVFLLYVVLHSQGFFAKPATNADGSMNIMFWNTGIPGKKGVRALLMLLPVPLARAHWTQTNLSCHFCCIFDEHWPDPLGKRRFSSDHGILGRLPHQSSHLYASLAPFRVLFDFSSFLLSLCY